MTFWWLWWSRKRQPYGNLWLWTIFKLMVKNWPHDTNVFENPAPVPLSATCTVHMWATNLSVSAWTRTRYFQQARQVNCICGHSGCDGIIFHHLTRNTLLIWGNWMQLRDVLICCADLSSDLPVIGRVVWEWLLGLWSEESLPAIPKCLLGCVGDQFCCWVVIWQWGVSV